MENLRPPLSKERKGDSDETLTVGRRTERVRRIISILTGKVRGGREDPGISSVGGEKDLTLRCRISSRY